MATKHAIHFCARLAGVICRRLPLRLFARMVRHLLILADAGTDASRRGSVPPTSQKEPSDHDGTNWPRSHADNNDDRRRLALE
jgi:hypothetical protein